MRVVMIAQWRHMRFEVVTVAPVGARLFERDGGAAPKTKCNQSHNFGA